MKTFKSKLIGKTAYITDKESNWYDFWGTIVAYDGECYHISGGCIGNDLAPIFNRDQFLVRREKKNRK
jgi:hypothetical protein